MYCWFLIFSHVNFFKNRNQVKDNIIKVFAGPADTGIFSPSVQNTIHITQKLVLDTIPEVYSFVFQKYCSLKLIFSHCRTRFDWWKWNCPMYITSILICPSFHGWAALQTIRFYFLWINHLEISVQLSLAHWRLISNFIIISEKMNLCSLY
jgi:hypothetical protein